MVQAGSSAIHAVITGLGVLFLIIVIVPAGACSEVDIQGSFTIKNSPPELTSFFVTEEIIDIPPSKPMTVYVLKMNITDPNTLHDIKEIFIVITMDMSDISGSNKTNLISYIWTPEKGWEPRGSNNWMIYEFGSNGPDYLGASSGTWKLTLIPDNRNWQYPWDISVKVRDNEEQIKDDYIYDPTAEVTRQFITIEPLNSFFNSLFRFFNV